ncbi:MAG TPA: hypothetical protein VG405_11680 [Solirubrobacteraceae bacterium]|jgi:hypothetical protein|nr:hypothetical protein [Solirubrobacteraceae bacterium]
MTDIAAPPLAAPPATAAEPAHVDGPPVIPEFTIVPRAGIVIAGVVLVLLVVAVAANKLWPLMFLHVVGGAGWTIVDLFVGLLIGPILGRLPLQSRIDFTTRFMPKMVVLMPILVATTLAAGWQLASHEGTNLIGDPVHGWIVASFIVVGVMAVLALGLLEPANIAVLIELKKPRPNGQVIERLMKRFVYCAGILGIMQVATFVIMTHIASS